MRIAERLSLSEWRMGAICCVTGGNEELYARRCWNGQRVQIQIFLDGFSLADIPSGLLLATIDLGRQGYSREFLRRILFVTLACSITCSRSASPARPSSTGFSLCDFRSSGKAHRLKSVLPKPALHRMATRHIKLPSKNRNPFGVCEKCRLGITEKDRSGWVSPPEILRCPPLSINADVIPQLIYI